MSVEDRKLSREFRGIAWEFQNKGYVDLTKRSLEAAAGLGMTLNYLVDSGRAREAMAYAQKTKEWTSRKI